MATYLTADELARLERLSGEAHKGAAERTLEEADLDDAAFLSRVLDTSGVSPLDSTGTANAAYVNTVDLYRAASICWSQKASIFAEEFAFIDGGMFQRNQKYTMAVKQAARYADMAAGWSPVAKAVKLA